MASQYQVMASVIEPQFDDIDIAGIPFPAENCASKFDFPPILDSGSSLGEVLAFIRTVIDRPAANFRPVRFKAPSV